jgi:hypothetical protein
MKKLFILSTLAALFLCQAIAQKQWHLDKKKNKKTEAVAPEKNLKLPLNLMIR